MLEAIIVVFAIYGLTWGIQNSELLSVSRGWIMRKSVFAFKLLSCSFCVGFYSGMLIYLLSQSVHSFNLFLIWGLAGSGISFILTGLGNKSSTLE